MNTLDAPVSRGLRMPIWLEALSRRRKQLLMAAWDSTVAPLCLLGGVALRLGIADPWESIGWWELLGIAAVTPPVFRWAGLYREVTRYIGPRYAWLLASGCVGVAVAGAAISAFTPDRGAGIPRTAVPIAAVLLFLASGGARLVARHLIRASHPSRNRVAIFGAGDAGAGLMSAISHDRATEVVAFFDDSPALAGGTIRGIPVLSTDDLAGSLARLGADSLLVALGPGARARCRDKLSMVAGTGRRVLLVPTLAEIRDGRVSVDRFRAVALPDLLGRPQVPADRALLAANVTGKCVMVTGAGGSIGSELCRQIMDLSPRELVLVDNGEFNLFQVDSELHAPARSLAPGSSRPVVHRYLASVTDAVRMDRILAHHRPDCIYHAAAYKHVPIVEDNEPEGADVNVLGTLRVAEAALRHRVPDMVLVSTDKAVRPTSVMGASKRMAELVLQALQERFGAASGTSFTMVRFGNVLGSSGSVVPIFERQIAEGGPVTVTHPDVARYFMTIPEAVELILQAGAMGRGGEIFVLDMGEPVRIDDLARNMIRLSGRSVRDGREPDGEIEIVYTGLRPGEKLFEELSSGPSLGRTAHPSILEAQEPFIPWDRLEPELQRLEALVSQHDSAGVREALLGATAQVPSRPS